MISRFLDRTISDLMVLVLGVVIVMLLTGPYLR
jgi:hypothetical protein